MKEKSIRDFLDADLNKLKERPDLSEELERHKIDWDSILSTVENAFAQVVENVNNGILEPDTPPTLEDLEQMEDDEFYEALYHRVISKHDEARTQQEQLFYHLAIFDMEIQNGGLSQYFANTEALEIEKIPKALEQLGALEHKFLYEAFLSDNHIDLQQDTFETDDIQEYIALIEKYPFDDFDDAYMKLTPLQELLTAYARVHLEKF